MCRKDVESGKVLEMPAVQRQKRHVVRHCGRGDPGVVAVDGLAERMAETHGVDGAPRVGADDLLVEGQDGHRVNARLEIGPASIAPAGTERAAQKLADGDEGKQGQAPLDQRPDRR